MSTELPPRGAVLEGVSAGGSAPRSRSGWLAITGLLLLSALPIIGGVLRLEDLSTDTANVPPPSLSAAIVTHIVAMSVFCVLGAFQFSPALRGRRGWHRRVGRALIPAGITAAMASIWLAVFFDGPADELGLAMVRLVFAVPMAVFLVLAAIAIARRRFAAHGAWMTRAFAIAVTGGTQALVLILWSVVGGETSIVSETWLVGVGFVINSLVAELIIRRRLSRG